MAEDNLTSLDAALNAFDADAFAKRHRGYKESRSRRSYEWIMPCPFCAGDRLRWHHEPGVKMAWICWHCRQTGSTVDLVQALEQTDRGGAVHFILAGYFGGDAPQRLTLVAAPPKPHHSHTIAKRLSPPAGFEIIDERNPGHWDAIRYLMGRGIDLPTMREYGIGCARTGRFAKYVIFPCFIDSALAYYQGRATWDPPNIPKPQRKAWEKATKYRKTLNPLADEGVNAAEVVFGYDRARSERHVVICEGPVDAIKVGPHAVALLGKEAPPAKVDLLLRMNAARYTIYLDRGEAEREKALALAAQLHEWAPTYLAEPPEGFDPGKLTPGQNQAVIQQAQPYQRRGLRSALKIV